MQCSPHQWALLELQKVIDYIVDYCILFGSGESRYEVSLVWCLSTGEALVTRYVVQSSRRVQDGVSFPLKQSQFSQGNPLLSSFSMGKSFWLIDRVSVGTPGCNGQDVDLGNRIKSQ